jgi:hypothetical protein
MGGAAGAAVTNDAGGKELETALFRLVVDEYCERQGVKVVVEEIE